jgi:hypothetical protein
VDNCEPCHISQWCNQEKETCYPVGDLHICIPKKCEHGHCGGSPIHHCCNGMCVKNGIDDECCVDEDCHGRCCNGTCSKGECCDGDRTCFPMVCRGNMCEMCENDDECPIGTICKRNGRCVPAPLCNNNDDCLDDDACTNDVCDTATGRCTHTAYDWKCECHTSVQCAHMEHVDSCKCSWCDRGKCRMVRTCDDSNPETTDICHEHGECKHEKCGHIPNRTEICHMNHKIQKHWSDDDGWFDGIDAWRDDGMATVSSPLSCYALTMAIDKKKRPEPSFFSPEVCADGDKCTFDTCLMNEHGACAHFLVDCDSHNPCMIDACSPDGTCVHRPLEYDGPNQSLDECLIWECSPSDGQFYLRPKIDCVIPPHMCKTIICNNDTCRVDVIDCEDQNNCTVDRCNKETKTCSNVPLECNDGNSKTYDVCDQASGACFHIHTTIPQPACDTTCDDHNLCSADTCGENGCVHAPRICQPPEDECSFAFCNHDTGACEIRPIECDDMDKCTTDKCDKHTGHCIHTPIICDDHLLCTDDSCVSATGMCVHTRKPCSDFDACTLDYCVEHIGCVHITAQYDSPWESRLVHDDLCDHVTGMPYEDNNTPIDDDNRPQCPRHVHVPRWFWVVFIVMTIITLGSVVYVVFESDNKRRTYMLVL